jgi:hypothetical protein
MLLNEDMRAANCSRHASGRLRRAKSTTAASPIRFQSGERKDHTSAGIQVDDFPESVGWYP